MFKVMAAFYVSLGIGSAFDAESLETYKSMTSQELWDSGCDLKGLAQHVTGTSDQDLDFKQRIRDAIQLQGFVFPTLEDVIAAIQRAKAAEAEIRANLAEADRLAAERTRLLTTVAAGSDGVLPAI